MKTYKKSIFIAICAISVLFAAVQHNDPDSYLWIGIYLFMAFLAYFGLKQKLKMQSLLFLGITYILWGINQFPPEWEGVLLDQVGMKTINIELGRESLGLFILAIFSFIMAWTVPEKE